MELQEKFNYIMQQMVREAEATMGPSLVQVAKSFYKENLEGYLEWLNYSSTIKSFKLGIPEEEFSPERFEKTKKMLQKTRKHR